MPVKKTIEPVKENPPSSNKIKTIIGIAILGILVAFISIKLINMFQSKDQNQYTIILKEYYKALNKGNTNDIKLLLSDSFRTEIPESMWLASNPQLFIFSVSKIEGTNSINASQKILYCVVNTRQKTAFLNEAYTIRDGKRLLLTYIDNLHKGVDVGN